MSTTATPLRIGIYGPDDITPSESRGCGLWPPGYVAAVTAAGGTPVPLELPKSSRSWDESIAELDGVLFLGGDVVSPRQAAAEEKLCQHCRDRGLPFLGVDRGMHVLNTTYGGSLHSDLPRDLPQALQHRHPPERGLRHAINVNPDTRLAALYGEGEIVVNSEHWRALNKVAAGFRVSATALDGVVEAIEAEGEDWFALGVQWHPASASASGLDIQLFRGLVEAGRQYQQQAAHAPAMAA